MLFFDMLLKTSTRIDSDQFIIGVFSHWEPVDFELLEDIKGSFDITKLCTGFQSGHEGVSIRHHVVYVHLLPVFEGHLCIPFS